jgi:hypothetical protein
MVNMYADGGKLPQSILRSRLESHMSPNEAQSYINKYDDGGPIMYSPGGEIDLHLNKKSEKDSPKITPQGFLTQDPMGLFIGGVGLNYKANDNLNISPYAIGVGNEYFQKFPVDYGVGVNYPMGRFNPSVRLGKNPGIGMSYKFNNGGTVDALQLMGMPTPPMYGGGSNVHPTLTLSTENNPNPGFQPSYSSNSFYNNLYSIDRRTTLSGTYPLINNKLNLIGSYDVNNVNNNYTGGLELNIGDILSGAGGKGPSRKYDNPDIAHKGRNSFLETQLDSSFFIKTRAKPVQSIKRSPSISKLFSRVNLFILLSLSKITSLTTESITDTPSFMQWSLKYLPTLFPSKCRA